MSNPKRNRARGKANQKELCDYYLKQGFKCRNVGILGEQDLELKCDNYEFYIEAKSKQKFVASGWMEQVEKHIQKSNENITPIVVVHMLKQRHNNDFVIMRNVDFVKLLKSLKGGK